MSKKTIADLLQTALLTLKNSGDLAIDIPAFQIDTTKDKQHGDFASNIAMLLAKPTGRKPRELAELIIKALPPSSAVTKVEIAGPGFINFFLSADAFTNVIKEILKEKQNYGRSAIGKGKKILVEFVSSNPTGPLHVGHGRHAAYGAVVADLLAFTGHEVHREYYVNDAGRQMDIIAVSVWLRYLALTENDFVFPANGYQGDYVVEIATALQKKFGKRFCVDIKTLFENLPLDEPMGGDKELYIDAVIVKAKQMLGEAAFTDVLKFSLTAVMDDIRNDMDEFGVHFQEWFSEREFVESGKVAKDIALLKEKSCLYENEGALWFRATDFGDDKDRVVQRSNGQQTYFANDMSYHHDKFQRGFDEAITVLGSDHHGYMPRMKSAMKAFGIAPERLTYLLLQFVNLYRGKEQLKMSTRAGSFVTLRELREEVGNDAARFFFVMRKAEQPIDFDLELAKSKSNENPVYYIQYAHARICSVYRQLAEKQIAMNLEVPLNVLTEPQEVKLLTTLSHYPDMIKAAALQHEPHLVTNYLREVATDFHGYYNSQQFIVDDEMVRNARLALISATKQILVNGLTILGVSQPESM